MHSELTDLKLQAATLQLEMMRLRGELGADEQVSLSQIARLAGVSEYTVRRTFRNGLSKLAAGLLSKPDLPPHITRRIAENLQEPTTPEP